MEEKKLRAAREEIRAFQCRRDEGYVFVSYAHQDADLVYPLVLDWLRKGCNVYIDTDFEYHTSDRNWVELMKQALTSPQCRMAACFVSTHYAYSYASLLEVLTMRLERKRRDASGDSLPVDYIRLGDIQTGELAPELREEYEEKFQQLKKRMKFFRKGIREEGAAELLTDGLDCVFDGGPAGSSEEWLENLDNSFFAFEEGSFYRYLAHLMEKSLAPFNKNYHSARDSQDIQLQRLREAGVAVQKTETAQPAMGPEPLSDRDRLFQRATAGNSEAMGELGVHYLLGDMFPEIPRDPDQAIHWLELAFGAASRRASYLLGYLCYCGDNAVKTAIMREAQIQDVRRLAELGVACLTRAAERGFLPAILALCGGCGGIPEISYDEQRKQRLIYFDTLTGWPEEDVDYPVAQCFLGKIYKDDWVLPLVENAAGQGCIQAMYYLADHYASKMKGPGKAVNGPKALAWYLKAAEAEPLPLVLEHDIAALYRTGRISLTGSWRRHERDACRRARYQLAECYGKRPGKWDIISDAPDTEKAALWAQRAQELEECS